MTVLLLAVVLVVSLTLSGLCSGAEMGFLSISRARLLSLARQKGNSAKKRLFAILNDLPNSITTLLVANNIANVTLSTVSATLAVHIFPESQNYQSIWACVTAIVTLFIGEYLPKLLFSTKPLRRTLAITGIFHIISVILTPIVWCFSLFIKHVFRIKNQTPPNMSLSRDTLRFIVADRHDSTFLSSFERRLIDKVLTLQATSAGELAHAPTEDDMLTTLKISSTTRGDDILPLMRKKHQRIADVIDPVTFESIGIVTEEDILLLLTGVLKEE
jgi:putative hemolysin